MGAATALLKKIRERWHIDITKYEEGLLKNDASILSYLNNQYLLSSGISYESDDEYQYFKLIHKMLCLYTADDLTFRRVGNISDGGYVMVHPYSENRVAFSLGIHKDVSWDLEIADAGYDVFQYDHTIRKLPIRHRRFHWTRKGISGSNHGDYIDIRRMIEDSGHSDESGFLLKMDIEGSEWDAIEAAGGDDISRFDQIIVELHDLLNPANRTRVINCLEKLTENHVVIHVHGNNYEKVYWRGDTLLPNSLEVTLIKKDRHRFRVSTEALPGMFDAPNDDTMPDIFLGQWNRDLRIDE